MGQERLSLWWRFSTRGFPIREFPIREFPIREFYQRVSEATPSLHKLAETLYQSFSEECSSSIGAFIAESLRLEEDNDLKWV